MTTQSTNLAKERTPAETGIRGAFENGHRRTKPGKEEKAPAPNKTPRKTLGRTVKQPGLAETSQGGRPSILTDALTAQLSHHVAAGNFASTACALVGVSEHSFYNWLNRGERELLEGEDSPYTRFFQSIKKAAAMAEADHLQKGLQGKMGWQAHFTFLERRYPSRWGHQMKLDLEEAKQFVRRLLETIAIHIPDKALLKTIVHEVALVKLKKGSGGGG